MKGSELARAEGPAGAAALRWEEAGRGRGRWSVRVARPRAERGRRKGSVCLGVRTATGRDGSRKGSGLRETGDGEAHRWLFLFRTLDRYITILLLLLLLLSLLLFFREKKKQLSYHTRGFSLLDGCEDGLWTFKDTAPGWLPPGACRMGASRRGAQGLEQRGAQVVGEARRGRRGGAGRAAVFVMV